MPRSARAGLGIADVSVPDQPKVLGAFSVMAGYPGLGAGSVNSVAVAGTTAFLALGRFGITAVDVTDPQAIRELGHASTDAYVGDLVLAAPFLLGCSGPEFDDGWAKPGTQLVAWDWRDLAQPAPVAVPELGGNARSVAVAGDLVAVSDYSAGLLLLGPSGVNPPTATPQPRPTRTAAATPTPATSATPPGRRQVLYLPATYQPGQPPAAAVFALTDQQGGYRSRVAVLGNRAYVAAGSRIDVLSLADPDHPRRLGQTAPLGWAIGDVVAQDGLVYVVAFMMSDPEAPWAVTPLLFIFEVPADGAPREVGRLALNPLGGGNWEPTIATPPLSLAVDGGRAYVLSDAVGSSGAAVIAVVIDVSQPASPRHLGLAPVAALSTNRLAAEGGHLYMAGAASIGGMPGDSEDGLWVLDLSDVAHPQRIGLAAVPLSTPHSLLLDGVRAWDRLQRRLGRRGRDRPGPARGPGPLLGGGDMGLHRPLGGGWRLRLHPAPLPRPPVRPGCVRPGADPPRGRASAAGPRTARALAG